VAKPSLDDTWPSPPGVDARGLDLKGFDDAGGDKTGREETGRDETGRDETGAFLREIASAPALPPPLVVVPGTKWSASGRYEIQRRLGRGGMGTVYEATDTLLGRAVALKVLDCVAGAHEASAQLRLLNEARLAATVDHERVARVYDVGTHEGFAFVAMEYVEGATLRTKMDGPVDWSWAVEWGRQIAEGLAELHRRGVIHRDLKPENVMLTAQGTVKLLDFGLARQTEESKVATPIPVALKAPEASRITTMAGTPGYMSPEQYLGKMLDPRVDVFALGVILYEMIAHRRPFVGATSYAIAHATLEERPTFDGPVWRRVPKSLRSIIAKMLSREIEARFLDASEVLTALRALPVKPRRRWWWLPVLVATVAVVGVVGAMQRSSTRQVMPTPQGMVLVQAGELEVGRNESELKDECAAMGKGCDWSLLSREIPSVRVQLAPFFLDRTEVTNQAFAEFLAAQRGTLFVADDEDDHLPRFVRRNAGVDDFDVLLDLDSTIGGMAYDRSWPEAFRAIEDRKQLPVVQVSWFGAKRYCESKGKRLPTENEWEAAARGRENRRFPWGHDWPACPGVVVPDNGELPVTGCPREAVPQVVGTASRDRTPDGVLDLGGNVAEWTASAYVEGGARSEFKGVGRDQPRVVRGGSFAHARPARTSARLFSTPTSMAPNLGFRCAVDAVRSER
jgi:formylglycine-generating enzyme required for sulfatase activity/predicted Ser/Thr protein kinase